MSNGLVIHTEASIGWGGQEIRVVTEMRYMRERGYRTLLIAPECSEIYKRASAEGLPTMSCGLNKYSRFFDFFRLWAFFRKSAPLMVGTHSSIDSWVGLLAAKAAGVPLTVRYRHISAPTKNTPTSRFIYRKLADFVVTTGDCISLPLIKDLGLPASKVYTIPTGVTLPRTLPNREEARLNLIKELGVDNSSRFIGMVAVLRSWKGHRFLMKAFELLSSRYPDYHLVIVGDGPIAQTLKDEAKSFSCHNRIHFTGHKTNVFDYFSAFDVAVLASIKNEGIPQSLLQAMWARTPVVGTTVGGIPEIVLEGKTGLLCEPENPEALARAISRTLEDPQASADRVMAAFEKVRRFHTVSAMGGAIEKLMALRLGDGVFPSPLPTQSEAPIGQ